jgi:hypothetical protein
MKKILNFNNDIRVFITRKASCIISVKFREKAKLLGFIPIWRVRREYDFDLEGYWNPLNLHPDRPIVIKGTYGLYIREYWNREYFDLDNRISEIVKEIYEENKVILLIGREIKKQMK